MAKPKGSKLSLLHWAVLLVVLVVVSFGLVAWYVFRIAGTVTVHGTLESVRSPGPDAGLIYSVKDSDGHVWSAQNCGFIDLPAAKVDDVASGDTVTVHGKLDEQASYSINLCGSSSYFVEKN